MGILIPNASGRKAQAAIKVRRMAMGSCIQTETGSRSQSASAGRAFIRAVCGFKSVIVPNGRSGFTAAAERAWKKRAESSPHTKHRVSVTQFDAISCRAQSKPILHYTISDEEAEAALFPKLTSNVFIPWFIAIRKKLEKRSEL